MPLQTLDIDANTPKDISGNEAEIEEDIEIKVLEDSMNELIEEDDEDEEDLELDMEEEEADDDQEAELEEEDEDDEDDSEEIELEDEPEEEAPKGKRANDRIRSLVEEKNKTAEALAKERAERLRLQKQLVDTQKTAVASNANLLESQVVALKSALIQAQNEGNQEQAVELQMQLHKAQTDLDTLKNWTAPESPSDEEIEAASQVQADVYANGPEALRNWVDDNPWVQTPITAEDEERRAEALAYSQILENKGYKMDSPEFYNMIDERLNKLGLANGKKNKVKSEASGKKGSKSSTGRKKKKVSQTVQGASRTPHSKSKRRNNNKVTLSKEQLEIAELYGMTPKEYAKEVLKMEKAEKQNRRMVTVFE